MFDTSKAKHVFLAIGYTDLRYGIDGLVNLVATTYQKDPQTNSLFLFCGRKKDRIKGLYWDGDGYLLLYKRLEVGRFQWPQNASELKELTWQQFRWLMEGLNIYQPNALREIQEKYTYQTTILK